MKNEILKQMLDFGERIESINRQIKIYNHNKEQLLDFGAKKDDFRIVKIDEAVQRLESNKQRLKNRIKAKMEEYQENLKTL